MGPGHLVSLASLGHEILGRDGCLELAGKQGSFARGGNQDIISIASSFGRAGLGWDRTGRDGKGADGHLLASLIRISLWRYVLHLWAGHQQC